jgi:hypothetical protein
LTLSPTALHAVMAGQAMPKRWLAVAPEGFGVGWIDQEDPSQRSAKVCCTPALVVLSPMAKQAELVVHDVPEKRVAVAPEGFGVDCSDHAEPFHHSASDNCVPAPSK